MSARPYSPRGASQPAAAALRGTRHRGSPRPSPMGPAPDNHGAEAGADCGSDSEASRARADALVDAGPGEESRGIPRDVHRIWRAHALKPHRVATFKFTTDPDAEDKIYDVVGLYLNPPTHAVVLSLDEKTQIQALSRTQPLLPLRPGLPARQTHDYRRNG